MKTSNTADALTAIEAFSTSGDQTSPYFVNVSLADMVNGLTQYINDPDSLHQGYGTNLCGPSAITTQVFLKYNPVDFVNILCSLYTSGSVSFDNGVQIIHLNPSQNIKNSVSIIQNRFATVVSQMFLFTLREHFAELHYFEGAQNTIWASTILGGEKKVVDDFLAADNVRFGETTLRGVPDRDVHVEEIQGAIDQSNIAVILVDSGYLQNLGNRYPNFGRYETGNLAGTHYISILGVSCDSSDVVTLNWWDYGGRYTQTMSLTDFKRMIWGGIYIKRP